MKFIKMNEPVFRLSTYSWLIQILNKFSQDTGHLNERKKLRSKVSWIMVISKVPQILNGNL